MEKQKNDGNGYHAGSDDNQKESAQEMAYDFLDLQSGDLGGVSVIQAISEFCTKYNINEPETLVPVQSNIKDRMSSFQSVIELADRLAEEKRTCETQ